MNKNKVVGIVHIHANQALAVASQIFCRCLNAHGYNAEVLDISIQADQERLSDYVAQGCIAFAFGIQGVGSQLKTADGVNLWGAAQTPFLSLHYDHPCYNPAHHSADTPFVANFYFFSSFVDVKQRYLPSTQVAALLPYEIYEIPPEPRIEFMARPIRLLFLKTGATLEEPERQFSALPAGMQRTVKQLLQRAEAEPNGQICDIVQEIFVHHQLNRDDNQKLFWGLSQVMDTYIRRKRAIDFVEWLKFQDGAVIMGEGWDFIDRKGARAKFKPSIPSHETIWLYEQSQFICNTNPYGKDIVHERVIGGLLMGGCVISDRNAWLQEELGTIQALTLFDWSQSLEKQLRPALEHPRVAEFSSLARSAVLEKFRSQKSIELLIEAAKQIKAALQVNASAAKTAQAAF